MSKKKRKYSGKKIKGGKIYIYIYRDKKSVFDIDLRNLQIASLFVYKKIYIFAL